MSEIIKNKLYLGDISYLEQCLNKDTKGITCIICVADINLNIININSNTKIYKYDLLDDYTCNISLYFDEIGNIIKNEKIVLVNCIA